MKINNKWISFYSLALLVFSLFLVSCDQDAADDNVITNIDYIGIEETKFVWVPEGETVTVDVAVVASRAASSDRVVGLDVLEEVTTVDPSNYTAPSSVTIPAGETLVTFPVQVSASDFAKRHIVIELMPDADFHVAVVNYDELDQDAEYVGPAIVESADYARLTLYAQRPCLDTVVTLQIDTDDYPEETSYELYDLSGTPTVIASGGPYAGAEFENTTITEEFCLTSGTYGIIVYDSWGDGIVGGGYTVSANGDTLTSGIVSGTFGSSTFTVD